MSKIRVETMRSHASFVEARCPDGVTIAADMRDAADEIERLEADLAEEKAKNGLTYCAYCGHEEPIDGDAGLIAKHIATCEKHPMRRVEAELAEARAGLAKMSHRRCRDCGHEAHYLSATIPDCLCEKCNSVDTRLIREAAEAAKGRK